MTNPSKSLTTHLLSLDKEGLKKATQAPFLVQAGKGTLPKEVLEKWLGQDRLYAQAYINFGSRLLAGLAAKLPPKVNPDHLNERLTDLVLDALNNVRRELKFFEEVASKYSLDINAADDVKMASEGVKAYRRLFDSIGSQAQNGERSYVLEGLMLLWGTEICYLEAWRYAKGFPNKEEDQKDKDGGALRNEFIPNWTSDEFANFVGKMGRFVDEAWGQLESSELGNCAMLEKMEGIWKGVLDVEQVFWPKVEE
ncbi:related to transcription regulator PAB1642 [Phialocephala subalpina]|uniref:Related to transcription regulator PAB1642 n=1 Tax=Phialocephala subalpina TaxID=576137 RepID=A0A1L7X7Q4_9HELO|nr:related to transcription regulator PAB1642 [Phialocephala subalpina]